MQLETLPREESAGVSGGARLHVQRLRLTPELREGDSAVGGNGDATGGLRQELAPLLIFGAATPILEISPRVEERSRPNESSLEPGYIGERAPRKAILPTVHPEAEALLSDRLRGLLQSVISICATKAKESTIRIDSINASSFRDPEEGWTEVVLNISVVANPPQALAFWDSIGRAIDRWKQRLPTRLAELLDDQVAVHVFWS